MNNYAIIENGVVINVIVWDGNTETWVPPQGLEAVAMPADLEGVSIGWAYDGNMFSAPANPA